MIGRIDNVMIRLAAGKIGGDFFVEVTFQFNGNFAFAGADRDPAVLRDSVVAWYMEYAGWPSPQ